jgi:hypothetical protein
MAEIAGQVLSFLAANPDRLMRFFDETGLSPADLRRIAAEPDFATTLLDYLASDERRFVEFAQEHGYQPAALDRLRQRLAPRIDEP